MKIEIIHDALANTVYQRADGDDRLRLKVANLIHAKYQVYLDNGKPSSYLLSKDDLVYIKRFVPQLVLSEDEREFIKDSWTKAKRQTIMTWLMVALCFIALIWLVISNYNAWYNAKAANLKLADERDALMTSNDSIQTLLNREYELKQKIELRDELLDKTNDELQELVLEREVLIKQLKERNIELKAAKAAIEAQNKALAKTNLQLEKDIAKKEKAKAVIEERISVQQKSLKLSRKAQLLLSSKSPSEQQIKEAFLLARASWELYNNNNQAMDVLNEIKLQKLPNNNGTFLSKQAPRYTYTHNKIQRIIDKLAPRYGKLNQSQISSYLSPN